MNRWEDTIKDFARGIAEDPSRIPAAFDAIQAGMDAFVAKEKAKRDGLARTAIGSLMLIARTKGHSYPFLLDPAYHQFPDGPAGSSPAELRYWDAFLKDIEGDGQDDELRHWVAETRGPDCLAWWDRVVVPALAGRATQERG